MNTEILYLNDKSGSMDHMREAVINGFNSFVAEQKAVPGDARLTHVQFDHIYTVLYQAKPLADVPLLSQHTYEPGGGTALYDAIGATLEAQGKRIATEQWAELVIVAINTDGADNQSRHYTREQINTMITHAQNNGWKFIFLAANQDAFAAGAAMGIAPQFTRGYTASAAGMTEAYGATNAMTTSLRAGPETPKAWADALKQASTTTPQP